MGIAGSDAAKNAADMVLLGRGSRVHRHRVEEGEWGFEWS